MGRAVKKKRRKGTHSSATPDKSSKSAQKAFPLWKGLVTSLAALVVFLGILEGLLALFGVQPEIQKGDPFVGFSSNIPLFVEKTDEHGQEVMATASNKFDFFNDQKFPLHKAPGTYRIFTVGGSTTFGRPYYDPTSFPGWMRALLPYADPKKRWEVINAGGISYASYRVAHLMKELVRYKPDLFIIYSGHNEFLEERTYGTLRDTASIVRKTAELLSRTRTWSAASAVLNRLELSTSPEQDERDVLSGEVKPILDKSVGLKTYKRDDSLRSHILDHYRLSLERMVDIARSAGAEVIFVTPASNLKDSSPFKSQHSGGLSDEERTRSERLLSVTMDHIRNAEWSEALRVLDEAVSLDPRYAEHHYRRGKALFALGRSDEAFEAFKRARDEDICPLRALTPMREILEEVAREKSVKLVDFLDLIEQRYETEYGHSIPGEEYFIDHVHPTIKGNRLLAVELVETMADMGVLTLADTWGKTAIAEVTEDIEGSLDREKQARALLNIVGVYYWAGKYDDAIRITGEILNSGIQNKQVIRSSAILAAEISKKFGDIKAATGYYREALKASATNPDAHLRFGGIFLKNPFRNLIVASAHTLLACALTPDNEFAHYLFGLASAERGYYPLAYPSVKKALELNPENNGAKSLLEGLEEKLSRSVDNLILADITVDTYTSGVPQRIVQVRQGSGGLNSPDGIWTEWYEDGLLKLFVDYKDGLKHGVEIALTPDGDIRSETHYRNGKRIENTHL